MRSIISIIIMGVFIGTIPIAAAASPKEDLAQFRNYFAKKFPEVKFETFKDGIYALDPVRRESWLEFEEFAPPYEEAVNLGKKLFETPFTNGKTYASCFRNKGIGILQHYPYFDRISGKVRTLALDINQCRTNNGEKPLKYKKGEMAAILAYMAFTSRGKTINVVVPQDPRAMAIYERGKRHFYAKRGQLNFSCADCHVHGAGINVRSELLSPSLGQVTHFPVWRKKWAAAARNPDDVTAGLGTLQRRYSGCNKNIRAKPYEAQGDEYIALEYFHTYMNNGLTLNGPALRQ